MEILRRNKLAIASVLMSALLPIVQGASPPNEYSLKSVFLYNFCRFIDWPDSAFSSPNEPIVIGILGDDPFGPLLEEAVQGESFRGRGIRIEHYRTPREIGRCHLLFVPSAEGSRMNEILAAVAGRSVITVGETEAFLDRGGMIALVADRNRVRLVVNPGALRAAKLEVSSKLLRVAEIRS